jgi:hypothetical protein
VIKITGKDKFVIFITDAENEQDYNKSVEES